MTVDHVTFLARCSYCKWMAQHRGPAMEVSDFLWRKLSDHLREQHADVIERETLPLAIVDSTGTR